MAQDRFVVMSIEDVPDEWDLDEEKLWADEGSSTLVDTKKGEIVYRDTYDSPEDKYLFRDLRVFVDKLNEVANGN